MTPTMKQLLTIALDNIEEAVTEYRTLIEAASDAELEQDDDAVAELVTQVFQMNQSIECVGADTDEVQRNQFLAAVDREAALRTGPVEPNEGELAAMVKATPLGHFAWLRFGSMFPSLALGCSETIFSASVTAWMEPKKWPKLVVQWRKLSGVSVSADTMSVGYSMRRSRGKRRSKGT